MNLQIIRMDYSRDPWRLVDADDVTIFGQEGCEGPRQICVPVTFEHPDCGTTTITEPVMGKTKSECMQRALQLLGRLIEQRRTK